uniref:Uncharacterized protein n=1 Tax=Caenorhabditis japonica TaxID=281687 RepID=A0A8R1ESI0_CAEJA
MLRSAEYETVDEIKMYLGGRDIRAPEALHHTYRFPCQEERRNLSPIHEGLFLLLDLAPTQITGRGFLFSCCNSIENTITYNTPYLTTILLKFLSQVFTRKSDKRQR